MYSRNFSTSKVTHGGIPVESFQDSFSAGAYLDSASSQMQSTQPVTVRKDEHDEKEHDQTMQHTEEAFAPVHTCNECSRKHCKKEGCIFGNIKFDDLILIGLLFMFMRDEKRFDDSLIPILLAIILIF